MNIIQKTNMKKITQTLLLATALTGMSASAMAKSNQVSVTVKTIEGYGEYWTATQMNRAWCKP